MADTPTNALSVLSEGAAALLRKSASTPAKAESPSAGNASRPPTAPQPAERASRSPQFQKPNPATARNGVPVATGSGEKQLDGTRSPTFSQPTKGRGLAERQPAPVAARGSSDQTSGLERAMASEADRLHPRKAPKSTTRK